MQSSPEAIAGLEMLHARVNVGTGLSHPNDRDAAISLFKLLRDEGFQWSPDEVMHWALAKGWDRDAAGDLVMVGEVVENYAAESWNRGYIADEAPSEPRAPSGSGMCRHCSTSPRRRRAAPRPYPLCRSRPA